MMSLDLQSKHTQLEDTITSTEAEGITDSILVLQ